MEEFIKEKESEKPNKAFLIVLALFSLAEVLLVSLKLNNFIDWSWWMVAIPLWGPVVLVSGIIAILLIAVCIAACFVDFPEDYYLDRCFTSSSTHDVKSEDSESATNEHEPIKIRTPTENDAENTPSEINTETHEEVQEEQKKEEIKVEKPKKTTRKRTKKIKTNEGEGTTTEEPRSPEGSQDTDK